MPAPRLHRPRLPHARAGAAGRPGRGPALARGSRGSAEGQALVGKLARVLHEAASARPRVAVLCSTALRPYLAGLASAALPHVTFLSPQEVPSGTRVRSIGMVS